MPNSLVSAFQVTPGSRAQPAFSNSSWLNPAVGAPLKSTKRPRIEKSAPCHTTRKRWLVDEYAIDAPAIHQVAVEDSTWSDEITRFGYDTMTECTLLAGPSF